jgi:hypothetical protein
MPRNTEAEDRLRQVLKVAHLFYEKDNDEDRNLTRDSRFFHTTDTCGLMRWARRPFFFAPCIAR